MQASNNIAFKEWAAVCEALGSGRQSLILRKGGIHEGRGGFRVDYREFWLFPTRYHEDRSELDPEAQPLLEQARKNAPPDGIVQLSLYVVVQDVVWIDNEALLANLAGLHVWSPQTVSKRFHYRRPGLFAVSVRTYRLAEPIDLPDSPHFGACRSWVELPAPLSTESLEPVLSDDQAERELDRVRRALSGTWVA